jgi:hypothetical protein
VEIQKRRLPVGVLLLKPGGASRLALRMRAGMTRPLKHLNRLPLPLPRLGAHLGAEVVRLLAFDGIKARTRKTWIIKT